MNCQPTELSNVSRADLHVHSRFSDAPSQWYLRAVDAPECFTEPQYVYEMCIQRGMTFVTITDHNSIEGALEIAHLPGTFLSSELTVSFPEDGCQFHCLVHGITPRQFESLDRLRENVYEFHKYVQHEGICATVAHPLFQVNDRLTVDHLERLLLLFSRFELINGMRCWRAAEITRVLLQGLTPAIIEGMSSRQKLVPCGPTPWKKSLTGGSDDHSGLYIARAFTCVERVQSVERFLDALRGGEHWAGGEHGSSQLLARGLLEIADRYFARRQQRRPGGNAGQMRKFLERLTGKAQPGLWQNLAHMLLRWVPDPFVHGRVVYKPTANRLRSKLLANQRGTHEFMEDGQRAVPFHSDCRLDLELQREFEAARALFDASTRKVIDTVRSVICEDRWLDCGRALPSAIAAGLTALAYFTAFNTQRKDDPLLRTVSEHWQLPIHEATFPTDHRLWATDTFNDVNGVTTTIHAFARCADERNLPLTILTCESSPLPSRIKAKTLSTVDSFHLPWYRSQQIQVPSLLELLDYVDRTRPRQLIISTPGPVGLATLLVGKVLRIPCVGIFHTDFPLYVRHLLGDATLAELAWEAVRWFYKQMELVFVPTSYYEKCLRENGFEAQRLRILPRGVDTDRYHPSKRRPSFWRSLGLEGFSFLYVGRVSREKHVDLLLESFMRFLQRGYRANLVVVGDGPQLEALKRQYRHRRIAFTGYLHGEELATAFASSDVFVFPSTTDTFGNVILEAQASGLPLIVSDRGGPAEIVERHRSGLIVDIRDDDALPEALERMFLDEELRETSQENALDAAKDYRWESIFEVLWNSAETEVVPRTLSQCRAGSRRSA